MADNMIFNNFFIQNVLKSLQRYDNLFEKPKKKVKNKSS